MPANRADCFGFWRGGFSMRPARPASRRWVRINLLASGMALDDLAAAVPGRPDGILLPKCIPDDLRTLDHYLSAFEAATALPQGGIRVIAIATETPAAMFALGNYAGVSARPASQGSPGKQNAEGSRPPALAANNRRVDGVYDDVYRLARSLCLLGATAAGVAPIDTIYTDFRDERPGSPPNVRRRGAPPSPPRWAIHSGTITGLSTGRSRSATPNSPGRATSWPYSAQPPSPARTRSTAR